MSVKIGIALGGGGARGLAHIGVLKVLEEEDIRIDCITGTSIGAVVGAMYAQKPNADSVIERFKQSLNEGFYDQLGLSYLKPNCVQSGSFLHQATQNIKKRIVINLAQSRKALLKEVRTKNILSKLIGEGNIEDTEIPLGVVATSLNSGNDILFKTGDIITATVASTSMPAFFEPIDFNSDLLTDGGVGCPVPVQFLSEMGADVTIGVEIGIREYHPLEVVNIIEIITRVDMITSRKLAQMMVDTADIAIRPNTKDIHWSDFSRADELIESGIISAREKLSEIKEIIQKKIPWYKRILFS